MNELPTIGHMHMCLQVSLYFINVLFTFLWKHKKKFRELFQP